MFTKSVVEKEKYILQITLGYNFLNGAVHLIDFEMSSKDAGKGGHKSSKHGKSRRNHTRVDYRLMHSGKGTDNETPSNIESSSVRHFPVVSLRYGIYSQCSVTWCFDSGLRRTVGRRIA